MQQNNLKSEKVEVLRNIEQLKWRSIRRSMLEVDLYLSKFIEYGGIEALTLEELGKYAQLLELPDSELLLLLQGVVDIKEYDALISKIKAIADIAI